MLQRGKEEVIAIHHKLTKFPPFIEFLGTTMKCLVSLDKDSWNTNNEKALLVPQSPYVSINALSCTVGISIIVSCRLFCRTELTVRIYYTRQCLKTASKPEGHNMKSHRLENPKTSMYRLCDSNPHFETIPQLSNTKQTKIQRLSSTCHKGIESAG